MSNSFSGSLSHWDCLKENSNQQCPPVLQSVESSVYERNQQNGRKSVPVKALWYSIKMGDPATNPPVSQFMSQGLYFVVCLCQTSSMDLWMVLGAICANVKKTAWLKYTEEYITSLWFMSWIFLVWDKHKTSIHFINQNELFDFREVTVPLFLSDEIINCLIELTSNWISMHFSYRFFPGDYVINYGLLINIPNWEEYSTRVLWSITEEVTELKAKCSYWRKPICPRGSFITLFGRDATYWAETLTIPSWGEIILISQLHPHNALFHFCDAL